MATTEQATHVTEVYQAVTEVYQVVPGDWIRQELLKPTYGISAEAARKYREKGMWLEEKHWRKDPANRVIYCRKEIDKWLAGQP